jgi:hypothetical protein
MSTQRDAEDTPERTNTDGTFAKRESVIKPASPRQRVNIFMSEAKEATSEAINCLAKRRHGRKTNF